ncbi:MAG: hypothetical protein KIH10_16970 [Candidatus Freyarchaeota archaeon]|nr:hypothetical protein [Candidatus Jordarchaeia archaeon]
MDKVKLEWSEVVIGGSNLLMVGLLDSIIYHEKIFHLLSVTHKRMLVCHEKLFHALSGHQYFLGLCGFIYKEGNISEFQNTYLKYTVKQNKQIKEASIVFREVFELFWL